MHIVPRRRRGSDGQADLENEVAFDRPLGTGPGQRRSLRAAASSGGRYGLVAAGIEQLATTITTVVLARLLAPREFGLVAAATLVFLFFNLVTRFGLGPALIRRDAVDRDVVNSLLLASVAFNTVLAVMVLPLSPLLASAVGAPSAGVYIAVLCALLPLGPMSEVPRSLLLRRGQFGRAYGLDIVSVLVYALTAIALAGIYDLGAGAIITGRILAAAVVAVAALALANVKPRWHVNWQTVRGELGFSAGFTSTHVLGFASKNADYLTVSLMGGPGLLGIYYIAYVLPVVIRQRMNSLVSDVLFPVLSRVRDDPTRLTHAYLAVLRLLCFIMFPMLFGIAVLAGDIVHVFFGERWSAAVLPMAIISVAAAVESVTQVSMSVLLAVGTPRQLVTVNAIRLLIMIGGMAVAAGFGTLGAVAVAVLVATAVSGVTAQLVVARHLTHGHRALLAAILPPLLPAGAMVATVALGIQALESSSALVRLASLVPVGVIVYVTVGLLTLRGLFHEMLAETWRLLRGRQAPSAVLGK